MTGTLFGKFLIEKENLLMYSQEVQQIQQVQEHQPHHAHP